MKKEDALTFVGKGWHSLIQQVYDASARIACVPEVDTIERKFGMLVVRFQLNELQTESDKFILDAIEYRIERRSSRVCEQCGAYAMRRIDLTETQSLCTACYAMAYSDLHPEVPESAKVASSDY